MNKPCYLYRLFGADDALLYVGISRSALARLGEHLGEKDWAPEVVRTTIQTHPTREEALAAERDAIQTERPRYNIQHNSQRSLALAAARGQTEHPRALRALEQGQLRLAGVESFYRFPLKLREVAAFGLRDGTCPVGMVDAVDDDGCWVSLVSFLDGSFGHETVRVEWADIKSLKKAQSYSLAEVKANYNNLDVILWGDEQPGWRYYDTSPLGRWQTEWCFKHLPQSAKACPCGRGRVQLRYERYGVMTSCAACGATPSLRELRDRMNAGYPE